MKKCQDFKEMISEYVDDELKGDSLHEFEEHINKCSECRKDLEDFKTLIAYFRNEPAEDLPIDFKDSLHKKLLAESDSNTGSSQRVKFIRKYMPVCAVAASLIMVFVFWINFKDVFRMGSSMEKTDSSLVYQLEKDSATAGDSDGAMNYSMERNESDLKYGKSYKNTTEGIEIEGSDKVEKFSYDKEKTKKNSGQSVQINKSAKSVQNTIDNKKTTSEQSPSTKDIDRKATKIKLSNAIAKTASVVISDVGTNRVDDIRNIALSYGAVEKFADAALIVTTSDNANVPVSENIEVTSQKTAIQQPILSGADEPVANDSNSSVKSKEVSDSTQLSFNIPNDRYSKFIEKIKERFGAANIILSTPVDVDNTEALNSLDSQIDILKTQLNKVGEARDISNHESIKTQIEELEKQRNEIISNTNYTTVTIKIVK